ncbi:uncharacterized protein [Equus asinus]|uniref:uncharacterized protein n=1 Tax=Equus asinus TaxID=9793 RepID=UPI0038F808AB
MFNLLDASPNDGRPPTTYEYICPKVLVLRHQVDDEMGEETGRRGPTESSSCLLETRFLALDRSASTDRLLLPGGGPLGEDRELAGCGKAESRTSWSVPELEPLRSGRPYWARLATRPSGSESSLMFAHAVMRALRKDKTLRCGVAVLVLDCMVLSPQRSILKESIWRLSSKGTRCTDADLQEWGLLGEDTFKGKFISIAAQASLLTRTQDVWFFHHLWRPAFPPYILATPTIGLISPSSLSASHMDKLIRKPTGSFLRVWKFKPCRGTLAPVTLPGYHKNPKPVFSCSFKPFLSLPGSHRALPGKPHYMSNK